MIKQRNIATCIILSIVTCGIYGIVWFFWLNDDANTASNEPNPTSSGMVFLLSLVTCGIYGMYWAYKQGEKLDRAYQMRGMATSSRGVTYLVLSIFGLGIIAYALMQDSLNKIGVPEGAYQQQPYQAPQQPYQQPYQAPQQPYQQPYQAPQQPYQQIPQQPADPYAAPQQPVDPNQYPPQNPNF